jgi:hypothetical protein
MTNANTRETTEQGERALSKQEVCYECTRTFTHAHRAEQGHLHPNARDNLIDAPDTACTFVGKKECSRSGNGNCSIICLKFDSSSNAVNRFI